MAAEVDQPKLTPEAPPLTAEQVNTRIAEAKAELHATVGAAEARVRYLADPRNFVREHPIPMPSPLAWRSSCWSAARAAWSGRSVVDAGSTPRPTTELPSALRTFVDVAMSGAHDPEGTARQTLSSELDAWARDPTTSAGPRIWPARRSTVPPDRDARSGWRSRWPRGRRPHGRPQGCRPACSASYRQPKAPSGQPRSRRDCRPGRGSGGRTKAP